MKHFVMSFCELFQKTYPSLFWRLVTYSLCEMCSAGMHTHGVREHTIESCIANGNVHFNLICLPGKVVTFHSCSQNVMQYHIKFLHCTLDSMLLIQSSGSAHCFAQLSNHQLWALVCVCCLCRFCTLFKI